MAGVKARKSAEALAGVHSGLVLVRVWAGQVLRSLAEADRVQVDRIPRDLARGDFIYVGSDQLHDLRTRRGCHAELPAQWRRAYVAFDDFHRCRVSFENAVRNAQRAALASRDDFADGDLPALDRAGNRLHHLLSRLRNSLPPLHMHDSPPRLSEVEAGLGAGIEELEAWMARISPLCEGEAEPEKVGLKERFVEVLQLVQEEPELSYRELEERTGIPKSTLNASWDVRRARQLALEYKAEGSTVARHPGRIVSTADGEFRVDAEYTDECPS